MGIRRARAPRTATPSPYAPEYEDPGRQTYWLPIRISPGRDADTDPAGGAQARALATTQLERRLLQTRRRPIRRGPGGTGWELAIDGSSIDRERCCHPPRGTAPTILTSRGPGESRNDLLATTATTSDFGPHIRFNCRKKTHPQRRIKPELCIRILTTSVVEFERVLLLAAAFLGDDIPQHHVIPMHQLLGAPIPMVGARLGLRSGLGLRLDLG